MNKPKIKPFPDLSRTRAALKRFDSPLRASTREAEFEKLVDAGKVNEAFTLLKAEEDKVREAFALDSADRNSRDNCMLIGLNTLRDWCQQEEARRNNK